MKSWKRWTRRLALPVVACIGAVLLMPSTPAFAFNGYSAASYADYWWSRANPNYPSYFSSLPWSSGDDCTNFVSQALHDPSGGHMAYVGGSSKTDDSQWWAHWNGSSFSNSNSWSVASDFYSFLLRDLPGGYPEGAARGQTQMQAQYTPNAVVTGDVLFYDWESDGHIDHVGIQTGIGTDPTTGMYGNYQDQHSNNHWHAFWSLLPYNSQWSTTTIYFMHIAANNP